jgi:hypothetical protein
MSQENQRELNDSEKVGGMAFPPAADTAVILLPSKTAARLSNRSGMSHTAVDMPQRGSVVSVGMSTLPKASTGKLILVWVLGLRNSATLRYSRVSVYLPSRDENRSDGPADSNAEPSPQLYFTILRSTISIGKSVGFTNAFASSGRKAGLWEIDSDIHS